MATIIHDAMLAASVRTTGTSFSAVSNPKPASLTTQPQKPAADSEPVEKKAPTEAELKKALQQANMEFAGSNQKISFIYEKRINQMFVQIVDKSSGEVVKEVPPKEFIEHKVAMHEFIGLLLDKQG